MSTPPKYAPPKYYAQKLRILELVEGADPGAPLPAERELAARFATSRTTIRQALAELVLEGRVARSQGRGTFVAEPPLIDVRQLTSFSEDLAGSRIDDRVLGIAVLAAPPGIAAALRLEPGSGVTRVERVRRRDWEALAHETAHLPGEFPGLAEALAARGSLYATLREAYGVSPERVEDEVGTELARPEEAELLGIAVGQPLLVVHRTARDARDAPIEHTRSVFRGDRFRFRASAKR